MNLKKFGFAILWKYVESLLKDIADAVWDALWEVLFEGIAEAEKKWDEGEFAEDKKEFVVEQVMEWVEEQEHFGWVRKKFIRMFLGIVIDRIVAELNEKVGEDWAEQAEDVKDDLSEFFEFLD